MTDALERGRAAYSAGAWAAAHELLTHADRAAPLGAGDLELLATAAYLIGHDEAHHDALERAHRGHLDDGEVPRAVRCAFWLGAHLVLRGEGARGSAWFARAGRLLDQHGRDCAERAYVCLAAHLGHARDADWPASLAASDEAARVAARFGDADALALALMGQGLSLIGMGRADHGLARLDEAMLDATGGGLSPVVTGLVYCGVIDGCRQVGEVGRAAEWTDVLTRWCERQAGLVPFTGTCLIHRAELMQLRGQWPAALEHVRQAGRRFALRSNARAMAAAAYRRGEILRQQGELAAAEQAFGEASRGGWDPQPGLALLRLAQGRREAAAAMIERLMLSAAGWPERAAVIPVYVEIQLAAGDLESAGRGAAELDRIASAEGGTMLRAQAALARGAVLLARGDAAPALPALRSALRLWQELDAPYECARARLLIARACRALGDDEGALLELRASRAGFAELGAAPDRRRADALLAAGRTDEVTGLTARELQVLRLLAAGCSNKAIAAELVLSKRTVDRHVSNIFAKTRVSSRAAATAYAYEHGLV